ncbi:MAG: hypothetical protein JWN14_3513 [Chthonomonadales bacterium]|nr:hypothetical protein [Chthonomonadales bacterium]
MPRLGGNEIENEPAQIALLQQAFGAAWTSSQTTASRTSARPAVFSTRTPTRPAVFISARMLSEHSGEHVVEPRFRRRGEVSALLITSLVMRPARSVVSAPEGAEKSPMVLAMPSTVSRTVPASRPTLMLIVEHILYSLLNLMEAMSAFL